MDIANKDEAIRALGLAEKAFKNAKATNNDSDWEKAERLCRKSLALCESAQAEALLRDITQAQRHSSAQNNHTHHNKERSNTDNLKEKESSSSESPLSYTSEQVEAVKKIISLPKSTPLHQVLLLESQDATEVEMKQAYKKLALQLHPDKNRAPGADEAFKRVSHAFTVLTDPSQKAKYMAGAYDMYEESSSTTPMGRTRTRMYEKDEFQYFGEDLTAEDIFRMFFGGGRAGFPSFMHDMDRGPSIFFTTSNNMRQRRQRPVGHSFFHNTRHVDHDDDEHSVDQDIRRERQREAVGQQQQSWLQLFLQFLPIFIILFFTYAADWFMLKDPQYDFQGMGRFNAPLRTSRRNTLFYVDSADWKQWSIQADERRQARFEADVERSWLSLLSRRCEAEKEERRQRISQAQGLFGMFLRDEAKLNQAIRMPMPWCDQLAQEGYTV